mgnify:CR=1 FL=1
MGALTLLETRGADELAGLAMKIAQAGETALAIELELFDSLCETVRASAADDKKFARPGAVEVKEGKGGLEMVRHASAPRATHQPRHHAA